MPYGKHARFFAGVVQHVGDVAGGENVVVIFHLQGIAHSQEQPFIQSQTCFFQPFRAASPGYPKHFVGVQGFTGIRDQQPFLNLGNWRSEVDLHTAIGQRLAEKLAHFRVVGGKDLVFGIKEVEAELSGVFATLLQFIPEAELHRQGELHTASASPDDSNGQWTFVVFNSGEQGKPAGIKTGNRFYRNGMLGCALNFINPGR